MLLAAGVVGAQTPEHAGSYERFAVAADHEVASRAGAEMLRAGGNAVDAAVAAAFTLSVVRPYSCGIGGGGFMVIRLVEHPRIEKAKLPLDTALNYRETCPAAIGREFFVGKEKDASTRGSLAIATPGTVAGLLHALEKYGTMERERVLAPAIRAAEEGFAVDAHYADAAGKLVAWFNEDGARKQRFAFVWSRFLRDGNVAVGDVITLPEQAAALRLIASGGREAFYSGAIADAVVRSAAEAGGVLTKEDLAAFAVKEVAPLRGARFGREFLTMPPPSSGGVTMLQALGILERRKRDLDEALGSPVDLSRHNKPDYVHLLAESWKTAFADRARFLADPDFAEVPLEKMLAEEYLDRRAFAIDPVMTHIARWYTHDSPLREKAGDEAPAPATPSDDGGTSHLCVVDGAGNAVACTETINLEFGSLVVPAAFGFALNNEMDDFTTRPGEANAFGLKQSDLNAPEPGKRPLSSMSPTIVLSADGGVEVVAGASGGPRIITGTMQAVLNVVVFDVPAAEAVSKARVHHQWMPDTMLVEEPLFTKTLEGAMRRRDHAAVKTGAVGNVQLIRPAKEEGKRWEAASDPRKGGRPAGE